MLQHNPVYISKLDHIIILYIKESDRMTFALYHYNQACFRTLNVQESYLQTKEFIMWFANYSIKLNKIKIIKLMKLLCLTSIGEKKSQLIQIGVNGTF
jgi:hypothetical protein